MTRLLQAVAQSGRPVVALVICEHERPEQSLVIAPSSPAEKVVSPFASVAGLTLRVQVELPAEKD
jgi:hypothetical protein